jgi:hypothetical protein
VSAAAIVAVFVWFGEFLARASGRQGCARRGRQALLCAHVFRRAAFFPVEERMACIACGVVSGDVF